MTFTTLRALHAIIGDALDEIERVYHAPQAQAPDYQDTDADAVSDLEARPLDFPPLDVPYYKNAPHSAEEEAAERLAAEPAVVGAANRIVAACGQLAAAVNRPFFSLVEGVHSGHLAACLRFLEASNTVEVLRAAGPDGIHVNDIAREIDELDPSHSSRHPVDPGKLGHILRLLATYHWLREVRPDVFTNNRLSALVDSGKTLEQLRAAPTSKHDGTDGIAAFVAMISDEFFKSIAHMTDALLPHKQRTAPLHSSEDCAAPSRYETPFNLAFRTELGYFEWLELPVNAARLREFGRAMTATRMWEVAENIIEAFPWTDLPQDALVVDVGGGVGSTSVVLAEAFPHLRFVVQDREQVVKIAPSIWGASHSELLASGRVIFLAHDFFTPQPQGTAASVRVFVVRGCTHNWSDDKVRKMLGLLRDAATADTKLLIVDVILPYACYDDSDNGELIPGAVRTFVPEGSPLLTNLGKASAPEYLMDISMMAVLNAKERTLHELSALASSAGWKIVRTTRARGSLWAYTTAEPI